MVFEGMAVLQRKKLFKCFLVLDSFALVTSVIAVVLLIFGKASRSSGSWKSFMAALHCLWASLICMIMAFYAALSAVTTTRAVSGIVGSFIYYGFFVLYYVVNYVVTPPWVVCTLWKAMWSTLKGRNSVVRRSIRQQYPVAATYALNLLIFKAIGYLAFAGTIAISTFSDQAKSELARHSWAPAPSP
uniref:Uncharacterized protein n=1 Tax=Avena sativa TaxID=4498 RepID=A0ACD6AQJ7_AVESA